MAPKNKQSLVKFTAGNEQETSVFLHWPKEMYAI